MGVVSQPASFRSVSYTHLAVRIRAGVEHDVVMRMGFVQMRTNDGFIPSGQKSADKFTADFMRLLRRHLSGPEGLDDVVALHPRCV